MAAQIQKPLYYANREQYKAQAKASAIELKKTYENFTKNINLEKIMGIVGGKGHSYSFHNLLFIALQTSMNGKNIEYCLKGYQQWRKDTFKNEKGIDEIFQVQKGEKAFKIFAPMMVESKAKKTEDSSIEIEEENKNEKKRLIFWLVNVFDVSQTSGYATWKKAHVNLNNLACSSAFDYEKAKAIIQPSLKSGELKFEEDSSKLEGENGYYVPSEHKIVVNLKIAPTPSRTLIHEFGHSLTYSTQNEYATNELLAEIVSFFIHQKFNVEFNFTYSQIWNQNLSKEISLSDFEKLYKFAEEKVSVYFKKNEGSNPRP